MLFRFKIVYLFGLVAVLVVLPAITIAQNLVPNFSFEQKQKCPPDFVSFHRDIYVSYWESANTGTPDYFNACANKCGVPYNWVGSAEAYHGQAYMGLIACMQQYDDRQIAYREYLIVKLTDSLQAGKQYFASMQVRLGLSCIASCNGLGMFFSQEKLRSDRNTLYPFRSDVSFRDRKPPKNKDEWIQICDIFTAVGGEGYLTIGNFLSNQHMEYHEFDENLITTDNISPMAYFYLDKVEVFQLNDTSSYNCESRVNEELLAFDGTLPESGKVILNNLYFDFDKDVILPSSYAELNQLALLLKAKPNVKIGLYGHTDDVGKLNYNQTLSENRAKAVKYYLIGKGVSRMRIASKGYGSAIPVASNLNDDGRRQNRRVELEILESF